MGRLQGVQSEIIQKSATARPRWAIPLAVFSVVIAGFGGYILGAAKIGDLLDPQSNLLEGCPGGRLLASRTNEVLILCDERIYARNSTRGEDDMAYVTSRWNWRIGNAMFGFDGPLRYMGPGTEKTGYWNDDFRWLDENGEFSFRTPEGKRIVVKRISL